MSRHLHAWTGALRGESSLPRGRFQFGRLLGLRLLRVSLLRGRLLRVAIVAALVAAGAGRSISAGGEEPAFERSAMPGAEGGRAFVDVRPGAVLTGVRVTVDKVGFGYGVIYSVQPIYRLPDGKTVRGKRHGPDRGIELVSEAKPGYALGALKASIGGRIDGFRCVFMRVEDGKLDAADAYDGRWLGAATDSPVLKDVSAEGKAPLGIQGREDDGVFALGLLLPREPGKPATNAEKAP